MEFYAITFGAAGSIWGGYTPVSEVTYEDARDWLANHLSQQKPQYLWTAKATKTKGVDQNLRQVAYYDLGCLTGDALGRARTYIAYLIRATNQKRIDGRGGQLQHQMGQQVYDLVAEVGDKYNPALKDKFQTPCIIKAERSATITVSVHDDKMPQKGDMVGRTWSMQWKPGVGTESDPCRFGKPLKYEDMKMPRDAELIQSMTLFERARSNRGGFFLHITGGAFEKSVAALKGGVETMQGFETAMEARTLEAYTDFLSTTLHREGAKLFVEKMEAYLRTHQTELLAEAANQAAAYEAELGSASHAASLSTTINTRRSPVAVIGGRRGATLLRNPKPTGPRIPADQATAAPVERITEEAPVGKSKATRTHKKTGAPSQGDGPKRAGH